DARYQQSLELLRRAHARKGEWPMLTKSGLMVGLGETVDELLDVFRDLAATGCDILTVGQYLAPTPRYIPIEKYYSPEAFAYLRDEALAMGFRYVESGPLVRSSYHAGRHTDGSATAADYGNDPIFNEAWNVEPPAPLVQLKGRSEAAD
ncbi:MAG TPA: hypothetical protein VIS78_05730, partial [Blastocatellia bacterium]